MHKKTAPFTGAVFIFNIKLLLSVFGRASAVEVESEKTGFVFNVVAFNCCLAELTAFKNALETDKTAECGLKVDFVAIFCCHPYVACAVGKLVNEALKIKIVYCKFSHS